MPASRYGKWGDLAWQIQEDWRTHYRDWTRPGFRALAVHRLGFLLNKKPHGLLWLLYRSLFRYCRNHYGVELPATTIIGRRLLVGHQHGIVLHERAIVGDDCIIRQNVTIGARGKHHNRAPVIGDRVGIGAGAALVGPITIGSNVGIAPNVTVFMHVPSNCVVVAAHPQLFRHHQPGSPSCAP